MSQNLFQRIYLNHPFIKKLKNFLLFQEVLFLATILKKVKKQTFLAEGAKYHHERFDGKGYPTNLAGTKIPWVARIISVADAFDAMSSTRPYRKRLPMEEIVEEIKKCSGTQFDPVVARAFLELYEEGAFDNIKTE